MPKIRRHVAIAVVFLIFSVVNAKSQVVRPRITVGANIMGAGPQGSFKSAYDFGGGGELFAGVGLGNTFILGTAGFSAFKATGGLRSGILTYIPVKAGLKRYFLRKLIFINADIGIASVNNKLYKESRFTRGIGAGVKLLGLEAALYYDGWKNIDPNAKGFQNSIFGKLGYSFSL